MEFTEAMGNLSISPVSAEFTYEDEDHVFWQLRYSRSEKIRVKADIRLDMIKENEHLEMVRYANKDHFTFELDDDICHVIYQNVLTAPNELYRRLPEISATMLTIVLFMERMCSCAG